MCCGGTHYRVVLVVFVRVHEFSHPRRDGHQLARRLPHHTTRAQIHCTQVSVAQLDDSDMYVYLAILMRSFITFLAPPRRGERGCVRAIGRGSVVLRMLYPQVDELQVLVHHGPTLRVTPGRGG